MNTLVVALTLALIFATPPVQKSPFSEPQSSEHYLLQ